jgi:hypothetical protein
LTTTPPDPRALCPPPLEIPGGGASTSASTSVSRRGLHLLPRGRPAAGRGRSGGTIPTGSLLVPAPTTGGRVSLPPHLVLPHRRVAEEPHAPARVLLVPAVTAAPSSFPCRRRAPVALPEGPTRGRGRNTQAKPGGATLLWLRPSESAPESVFHGAPAPEPEVKHPFGRAPPGAARGAGAGALPKRPSIVQLAA